MKINGETQYLWRAVDHEGEVMESYVTRRRDRKAALKFLRKSMKRYGQPEVIVTDKLRSYGAAMKVIGNAPKQETGRGLNNRAENSHLPFRRRERAMLRFRQMRCLQKFPSVHFSVHNHFDQGQYLTSKDKFNIHASICIFQIKSQRRTYCSKPRSCRQEGLNSFGTEWFSKTIIFCNLCVDFRLQYSKACEQALCIWESEFEDNSSAICVVCFGVFACAKGASCRGRHRDLPSWKPRQYVGHPSASRNISK